VKENDWLACHEIEKLLKYLPRLKPKPSARKLRLYCVGCCRWLGDKLDESCSQAVDVAEKYADGLATLEDLTAAHAHARRRHPSIPVYQLMTMNPERLGAKQLANHAWKAVDAAARPAAPVPKKAFEGLFLLATLSGGHALLYQTAPEVLSFMAALLHDVLGNPFRAPHIEPAWLAWNNGTVRTLAETIYDERAFDRLPILADALQDAGCADAAMLDHCRGPGPHTRGCWVVDALLGKE
jgi:hypothetical protein